MITLIKTRINLTTCTWTIMFTVMPIFQITKILKSSKEDHRSDKESKNSRKGWFEPRNEFLSPNVPVLLTIERDSSMASSLPFLFSHPPPRLHPPSRVCGRGGIMGWFRPRGERGRETEGEKRERVSSEGGIGQYYLRWLSLWLIIRPWLSLSFCPSVSVLLSPFLSPSPPLYSFSHFLSFSLSLSLSLSLLVYRYVHTYNI